MSPFRRDAVLAGLGGMVVALGLGIAGLTDAATVVGFLDLAGAWDPTALLVLGAAVLVYGLAYRRVSGSGRLAGQSVLTPSRHAPPDGRLLVGAALFGVGWGATGLCPAPALTAAASGEPPLLVFVAAMIAGMALHAVSARRKAQRSGRAAEMARCR